MEEPQVEEQHTNLWLKRGDVRPVWKVSAYHLAAFFLVFILYVLSYGITSSIDWRISSPLIMLLSALGVSWLLLVGVERKPFLPFLGLQWSSASLWYLFGGIAVAGLMQGLLLVLELLFGGARIFLGHLTGSYIVSLLAYSLVLFTLVGFSEEILIRGYPFRVLQRQSGDLWALLVTSVIFSVMHGANPGISWIAFANIFLAGIWLGVARMVSGSLWLPIGLHIGWNFFLGSVFGFPVSGIVDESLFITEVFGSELLSGGAFGPEGGLLATIVLIISTAALYFPRIQSLFPPRALEESAKTEHEDES
jgi:membrane protease YdiL (CAAX protease family)